LVLAPATAKELDLNNCVAVCFYEHLADHRAVRDDMPRWLSPDKFRDMAGLFEWRLVKMNSSP
jgi:hypothetical protein